MTSTFTPGATLWLTGMSGAGKSTLSARLVERLRALGHAVEWLDGDAVRPKLSPGQGFTREERHAHILRVGYVAGLLSRNGVLTVVSLISPYEQSRSEARDFSDRFLEIFVEAPLSTLVARDPKGLYARALRGEIPNFTGVTDPFEPPTAPDVTLRTDLVSVDEGVEHILATLRRRTWIPDDPFTALDPDETNARWARLSPLARLEDAFTRYGEDHLLFSSSFGVLSAGLCDLVARVAPGATVHFLDTGYHFPETIAFRDEVVARLGLKLRILRSSEDSRLALGPEPHAHNPDRCCHVNKVVPLEGPLQGKHGWISGLRRGQNRFRQSLNFVTVEEGGRHKLHPILDWSARDLETYIRERNLPLHPLRERGYTSIGCAPCTSPCSDTANERAGRWAGQEKTECGLHFRTGATT